MAPSVAPMQLLVSIVERGKGRELREHYRQFGLIHHNQAAGHGTAASHLLDALGFGTSERDIILTLGPKDTMLQLVYHLKDEDRSKLGTPGIAFTLNLSGMSAILAVALSRLEEMKPERGEQFMEQGNHHSLILATVNTGYTDEVMETAEAAACLDADSWALMRECYEKVPEAPKKQVSTGKPAEHTKEGLEGKNMD